MGKLDQLFRQLDAWRHLPTYQLERRADIFFALYLREVLAERTGLELHPIVIPEFPIHKRTLDGKVGNHQSFRVDYLAFSHDLDRAFLVELKTDATSTRDAQDHYLDRARGVGLSQLLQGLQEIFTASRAKRKYFHLFQILERLGLVENLEPLAKIMAGERLHGANRAARSIRFSTRDPAVSVIYIHPTISNGRCISFEQFRNVVQRHHDPVSQRFAESLENWQTPAGAMAG